MTDVAPPPATISRRGTLAVTAATVVAAVSGYAILVIAGRALGTDGYARFSVFWSVYFALLGVLFGLQQESTRSASAARTPTSRVPLAVADDRSATRVPIVLGCLAIGVVLGAVIAVSAPAWASTVFGEHAAPSVAVIAVASVFYAGQTGLLGALGGRRRWGTVALLLVIEATVRLVAVAVAAVMGWGVLGMSVATGAAALAWLGVVALSPSARQACRLRGDVRAGAFVRQSGQAMAAAASSAALVVGFPALLEVTTTGSLEDAGGGALVLAILLTRAPLMVPMSAFQGVAVSHFVAHRDAGARVLLRPALVLAGVGAVGSGAAWLVGEPIMTGVFGAEFHVAPGVLAALTAAATLIAGLTLTGSAALAAHRHRSYVAGWLLASAVAVAVLLLPSPLTTRALASLLVAPVAGIAVHVLGARPRPV